ncbi:4-hydroxythreonine-4-phosphate dehydrogenase PdxA [Pelistega europaea]|uniref:4-hydroxythreonine-4-phosphate dehydrogenase PdxA n=2 Tax=Pelistega europaea TaxID=106147 RepID=A0A7Y4L9P8_9BURK|nr:4-hydroxythreonine-4-phosphate dehydrogenase PdxA [Pelistega europaea]
MGDAAGIGPELIVKLFQQGLPTPAVVYGDVFSLQRAMEMLRHQHRVSDVSTAFKELKIVACQTPMEALAMPVGVIPVISCGIALDESVVMGEVSAAAGEGSYRFLVTAIEHAMQGDIDAIVTAPLHKVSLKKAGYDFPGHTEILAEKAGVDHVGMMLLNDELRVILVTIHMALAEVPQHITLDNEKMTIRLAAKACDQLGLKQARIAVAGLNPHAGEEGRFGNEDRDIIRPAIEMMQQEGVNVSGPYPGDTVFMRARRGEFDIVVAQYHDQGLIPVKYLGVDTGVNVTVGLPFIRTSVDHGTAFDIAGKGIADPSSLREAFVLAMKMLAGKG